jgi:hypothetical protein
MGFYIGGKVGPIGYSTRLSGGSTPRGPSQAQLNREARERQAQREAEHRQKCAEMWDKVQRETVLGHPDIAEDLNTDYWAERIDTHEHCRGDSALMLTFVLPFLSWVGLSFVFASHAKIEEDGDYIAALLAGGILWAIPALIVWAIFYGVAYLITAEERYDRKFLNAVNARFADLGHDVDTMLDEVRAERAKREERAAARAAAKKQRDLDRRYPAPKR